MRGKESSMCGCPLCTANWGPGLQLDWELNQQPFGSQAGAQSTEPHQPGQSFSFSFTLKFL